MSSYKDRLESSQERQAKARAARKLALTSTVGGVVVGPVATALVLDNVQLGPITGRQMFALAGVVLTFHKYGKKPAGQVIASAGRFAAGLEVYERSKSLGSIGGLLGLLGGG